MEYQYWFERKFYLDKKTGYWISTDYPRIRAHVWVWINYHGEIEKGSHIHHIDGNKSNNNVSNLEKLSSYDHGSLHMTKERKEWASKWAAVIRPLTKGWHKSEEGRKWHSNHARKTFARKNPIKKICINCGSIFVTDSIDDKRSLFCSNNCKSAHRRKSKKDNVQVPCAFCLKTFTKSKYAKTRFCSRGCSILGRKRKVSKKTT